MDVNDLRNAYGKARINDRQVSELIGLAHGLIADGRVNKAEAEYLHKWLVANQYAVENPIISELYFRVSDYFEDGQLDNDESVELFETLHALAGGDFELGEIQKATSLPLCRPEPEISFYNKNFCFTGTFCFGKRKDCEAAVVKHGGIAGSLTQKTNYLVVGEYATESWAHSSFGRKIEKAVDFKNRGLPIHLVSEEHWSSFIQK